jgi:transcriptional regulator with XRE-family HTH domain
MVYTKTRPQATPLSDSDSGIAKRPRRPTPPERASGSVLLGSYIRDQRTRVGLSLEDVSILSGGKITVPYLSGIERGRRYPSPQTLQVIADVLEIPTTDLERLDTRPPIRKIKNMCQDEPELGIVFRRLVEDTTSPKELLMKLREVG